MVILVGGADVLEELKEWSLLPSVVGPGGEVKSLCLQCLPEGVLG